MRTMLKVEVPVDAGSRAIEDGTLARVIEDTIDQVHPEATYFFAEDGHRTALMVFDLPEAADIPRIVEPLFSQLSARVTLLPAMDVADLRTGLRRMNRAAAVLA